MTALRTLDQLDLSCKTVLIRVDLNVPMRQGAVEDTTRITRLLPTLHYLIEQKAKIVLLSHFGRPQGVFERDLSLAPLTNALSDALGGKEVLFALDCIGPSAKEAITKLQPSDILLLENLRFHAGETANDDAFVTELASLGDYYINDTFSCSHRNHASIVGLANALPSAAGYLLQREVESLHHVLESSQRPVVAIVGGSKVSTKLEILKHLLQKVDTLIIGGAMANTFLAAKGHAIGRSLYEATLIDDAMAIMDQAEASGCHILLPSDVVIASALEPRTACSIVPATDVPDDQMILDIGADALAEIYECLQQCKTVLWNGPVGAFEVPPFNIGTASIARIIANLTTRGTITSVGGGGDVVAALNASGLDASFSYISTAGGAFLEWLEGKQLPGIAALSS